MSKEQRIFELTDGSFPPLPENLKGEHLQFIHEIRVDENGKVRHRWSGCVLLCGTSTRIGDEQETLEDTLKWISRQYDLHEELIRKRDAIPNEILCETHEKGFDKVLHWLETPGKRKIRANPEIAAKMREYGQALHAYNHREAANA